MAFGDHLRAEQDIDLTAMYRFKGRLRAAFFPGRIGIDAKHTGFRKQGVQILFDALRAAPEWLYIHIAAGGA